MRTCKKWILSLSICIVFLMSVVVGLAGSYHANKDDNSNVSNISLSIKPEVQYTFEPNTLSVQKGGDEIHYEYSPFNNVSSAPVAYEYSFINLMDEEMAINLKSIDTSEVNVSYHISTSELDKSTVTASSNTFELTKLAGHGDKVYIYIIVSPINASIPVDFTTSIVWYQGVSGSVTYIINNTPIKQDIVKGQILTPPEMDVSTGYKAVFYADEAKTEEIDIETHRSQGGTIYVGVKETGSLAYTYVNGYYKVAGIGTITSGKINIPEVWDDGTNGPHPVTEIGEAAFKSNTSITSVVIPASVTLIGKNSFSLCSEVTSIIFAENSQLETIGSQAFAYCNKLEDINFDNTSVLKTIEGLAFSNCSKITKVKFPASLQVLKFRCFGECRELSSVEFDPNSQLAKIMYGAFYFTDIVSIKIPKSVTFIEVFGTGSYYMNPFSACQNLISIVVDEENPVYDSRNNCNAIIHTDSNRLAVGCKTTVIPNTVTKIGFAAFDGVILKDITIPAWVTYIGSGAFDSITGSVTFEKTTKWSANGVSLDLTDPVANVTLLKETYKDYDWTRDVSAD